MKTYDYKGNVPPQSLHTKTLPGGDASPTSQSFHNKKAGAEGGELRPKGYQPKEKWGNL